MKNIRSGAFFAPCGKKSGKSGIKLDYVEPTDPKAGNTVAHAAVSKWDQTFSYGDASIKCTALTRFNDGQTAAGEKSEQGLRLTGRGLKRGLITGANLDYDCSEAEYYAISLCNNGKKALIGLDADIEADKAVLAPENGEPERAQSEKCEGINAAVLPEGFKGCVLFPVKNARESFGSVDIAWSGDITLRALLMCDTPLEMPGQGSKITNPLYSYTDKQRMQPFWECSTMYNEAMGMMKREDGSIWGKLLFVPTRINAVVDVYQKKEYKEGKDWQWIKGTNRIVRPEGSDIPYFTEEMLSGKEENGEFIPEFPAWTDGRSRFGACLYCVTDLIYEKQICVSYEYDLSQVKSEGIASTPCQSGCLVRTNARLKEGRDLKVLFYGDSIFSGCDASSMYNREPFMPYMHKLIESALASRSTGRVQVDNLAVGGWTVENGRDALFGDVGGHDYSKSYKGYDLMILSYGMNNAYTSEEEFKAATLKIMETVKEANPDIEIVLVSCMNPNPRVGWDVNQKHQGQWLREIAQMPAWQERTALVDFYQVHKSILAYKDFSSTTGNNINHPNDWLIRVYAQNIVRAITR